MTMKAVLPGTMIRKRLEFKYDYIGRRVEKIVKDGWTGSSGTIILHRKYVYDGWNLIAELDGSTNGVVRTFLWGLDLSGTVQGAGGVGGLLMIEEGAAQYLAVIDGGGNVTGLIDKSDGSVAAVYEYGPYGEPLRAEGSYAAKNPFRFSTKYTDSESGLVYYGLRYYEPTTGRFINRDPIGEAGGLNLYGFVGNDPINRIDFLGLTCADDPNGCGGDDGGGIVIGGSIDITGGGSSNNNVPNGLLEGLNRLGRMIIFGGLDDETLDNLENIDSLDSETHIETLILINDSVGLDGLVINEYLATTVFDLASYFVAPPVVPVVTANDQGSNDKDDNQGVEITISVGGINSQGKGLSDEARRRLIISIRLHKIRGDQDNDTTTNDIIKSGIEGAVEGAIGAAEIGIGFIPYIGDIYEGYIVIAPDSTTTDRVVSGTSVGVNIASAGIGPNAGPILRGVRRIFRNGDALTPAAKRRLAKELGGIPNSAQPIRQGRYGKGTKWWEYKDQQGNVKIIVEHSDGTVHVGRPKPHSNHLDGTGPPKYYPDPGSGHVGQ